MPLALLTVPYIQKYNMVSQLQLSNPLKQVPPGHTDPFYIMLYGSQAPKNNRALVVFNCSKVQCGFNKH